jgi:hypothetical protein
MVTHEGELPQAAVPSPEFSFSREAIGRSGNECVVSCVVRRTRAIAASICAVSVLGGGGCGQHIDLGEIGDGGASLLWRSTFEAGDLSEWTSDGAGGTRTENAPATPAVTDKMAHSGRYAGVATIAPMMGMDSLNYFYRRQPSPDEAYYGAWFYVPASFTGGSWLSLLHFRGSSDGDPTNLTGIWDVNLYTLPTGDLAAQLGDFISSFNLRQTSPVPVPRDTWVHFEVLFRKASDPGGRVAVWQDGALILDRAGVVTALSPLVVWEAGVGSDDLAPLPASVYVDDIAISVSRLGDTGI